MYLNGYGKPSLRLPHHADSNRMFTVLPACTFKEIVTFAHSVIGQIWARVSPLWFLFYVQRPITTVDNVEVGNPLFTRGPSPTICRVQSMGVSPFCALFAGPCGIK